MTLSQMKENQVGKITHINTDSILLRRLFDMGFDTGQDITCMNVGMFGTPIAFNVRGTKVALRKNDADMIGVVL